MQQPEFGMEFYAEPSAILSEFVQSLGAGAVRTLQEYDDIVEGGLHWSIIPHDAKRDSMHFCFVDSALYLSIDRCDFEGMTYSRELLQSILVALTGGHIKKLSSGRYYRYVITLPDAKFESLVWSSRFDFLGLGVFFCNVLGMGRYTEETYGLV